MALAVLPFTGTLIACEGQVVPVEAVAPGPDCAALIAVGTRALGCDPRLGPLMTELRASPDELRCRGAARLLLEPPALARGRVVSVYERPPAPDPSPLTADEHAALAELVLPGTLILVPDLAPGPGVPNTTATLDGAALGSDVRGQLSSTGQPGEHLLMVRHADRETLACVTLPACESLTLTAHGGSLAPHPALRPGPCEGLKHGP
ncbi:MAG: hypothetical protein H0T76_02740 [Nannocystis sp.]|nr:hypothetical protein [Nannocystis sp.]MBA3545378.1 hypothetical protein [Nannocystis sp.]